MNPDKKQLDTPYTKDEIDATNAAVTPRVRDCINTVVSAYVKQFEGLTDEQTAEYVPKFLPVMLALMEDSMLTGRYIAEEKIVKMLLDAGVAKMPVSASYIQN